VLRRTEITYVCDGCGQVLDAETVRVEYLPDDAETINNDSGDATPAANVADAETIKTVTEKHHAAAAGTTTVTVLIKSRDVPAILAETYDMPSALRLADGYAPDDAAERLAYKTGLTWLQRGEHEKAAAAAANVHDERAHAALVHLAERPPTLQVALCQ
jgi:hypothetical protein